MYAEIVLKKDLNLSTHEGLVNLAGELVVQNNSLDIASNNWDATLKILLEVNKTFFNQAWHYPLESFDISVKKGEIY